MTLTQQQIDGIKSLYGDNSTGADIALEKIGKKRGVLRIFNEDGTVNISLDELEKKLNKPSKKKVSNVENFTKTDEALEAINDAVNAIKHLKDLSGYFFIQTALKNALKELGKKKVELKEAEIKSIDEEMERLAQRKQKLIEEKENQ